MYSIFLICLTAFVVVCSRSALANISSPYGLTVSYEGEATLLYWYYPDVNEHIIQAVDDVPQAYYFYSTADVSARIAGGFELADKPCGIQSVELKLWSSDPFPNLSGDDTSPFELSLHGALQNSNTTESLWGGVFSAGNQYDGGWLKYPIHLISATDSVYVEFGWMPGTPTAPLPAVVFSDRFVNCYSGHVNGGTYVWQKMYDTIVLWRMRVNTSDIGAGVSGESEMPDSFTVFFFDSPALDESGEITSLTVSDSMHVYLDESQRNSRYATVAAWRDGLLSTKSEIIEINEPTDAKAEEETALPTPLQQNFPNPFNAETVILSSSPSKIVVFDILGRVVCELLPQSCDEGGQYRFIWTGSTKLGRTAPSGVYFYRQDGVVGVRKTLFLK